MKHNINPSKYYLYLSNGKITGLMLWSNESDPKLPHYDNIIEVCKQNNKCAYDLITDLFKSNLK